MKKWIALLLALVMCLALCACGGGEETAQQGGGAATDGLYQIGDTAEGEQFSFTLEAVQNVKYIAGGRLNHATNSATGKETLDRQDVVPNDGYAILRVQFKVDYSGKEKKEVNLKDSITLDFDDGYTFNAISWNAPMPTTQDKYSGYFDFNDDGDLRITINDPLGYKAESKTIYIFVNTEVVDQIDKPLVLKVDLPGEEEFVFNARKSLTEEERQEENYQSAKELMGDNSRMGYFYAMEYLQDLGDYKDSAELYKDAELHYNLLSYGTKESKQFLQDRLDTFTVLTGDQISAMMPGTWKLSSGSTEWVFSDDGLIDDGYDNGRTWTVDGDKLTLASNKNSNTYTVYEVYEGGYILIDESQPDSLDGTQYMFAFEG